MRLIENKATMDQVPDHMKGMVSEHIATHNLHVKTASDRILALPRQNMVVMAASLTAFITATWLVMKHKALE